MRCPGCFSLLPAHPLRHHSECVMSKCVETGITATRKDACGATGQDLDLLGLPPQPGPWGPETPFRWPHGTPRALSYWWKTEGRTRLVSGPDPGTLPTWGARGSPLLRASVYRRGACRKEAWRSPLLTLTQPNPAHSQRGRQSISSVSWERGSKTSTPPSRLFVSVAQM